MESKLEAFRARRYQSKIPDSKNIDITKTRGAFQQPVVSGRKLFQYSPVLSFCVSMLSFQDSHASEGGLPTCPVLSNKVVNCMIQQTDRQVKKSWCHGPTF